MPKAFPSQPSHTSGTPLIPEHTPTDPFFLGQTRGRSCPPLLHTRNACKLFFHLIVQKGTRPLCSSYPATYIRLSDELHLCPLFLTLRDPNFLFWWEVRAYFSFKTSSKYPLPSLQQSLHDPVFPLECSTSCVFVPQPTL